jgi:tetratricopeptide (TPR) repeat protein
MRVTDVVTGHYMKQGDQLQITLEAVDIADNRTLWRDTMTVAAPDMIAMRSQITAKVRQGLVPALGAGNESSETASHPRNEEAYDLYLRSLAMPHDPQPNKDAIAMLERSVGLDGTYAPAWSTLGVRYHYDGAYATGGTAAFQKSNAALERALALDPNFIFAAAWLITNHVERGEWVTAYPQAKELVEKHPESAQAHFALAYLLRYGGALEESGHECDAALAIDPGNFQLRSCALGFDQLGNYARALEFIQLDAGSLWASNNLMRHYLREKNIPLVRESLQKSGEASDVYRRAISGCLDSPSSATTNQLLNDLAAQILTDPDPEPHYVLAATFAFCGRRDLALSLLKSAIVGGHYCAYDGLRNEPLLAPLRDTPEFAQLLTAAKQCRDDFLSQRAKGAH